MVKSLSSLTTFTRAPIISVTTVALKRHSARQEAGPSLSRTSAHRCSARTSNPSQPHSLDVHQYPASSSSCTPWRTSVSTRPFAYNLLTRRPYIVGDQEAWRKTARSQENQRWPLTD